MRRLWKNRPLWFAAVFFVLCILLAAATVGDRRVSYTDGLFRSAALPIQEKLYAAQDAVRGFFIRVFHPSELEEENERLKEQLNRQAAQLAFFEDTARENARLTELLNFTDANPSIRFQTAAVIGRSTNPYIDTLTLNVGTRHGVASKMAVITPEGVIGRVSEIGPTWCRVRTLANDDMRISVTVQRTRDEGMYGGLFTLPDGTLGAKLYYLPDDATVRVGDVIVTSGLDEVFPKGLLIGTVVALDEGTGAYDAIVQWDADFSHLEEVLVLVPGGSAS
ncbi:MAG: rod shape-determining protein MreC [Clostridia bacterium]|nr:rod shape-determining protein MreC [Clostridia bacterium]